MYVCMYACLPVLKCLEMRLRSFEGGWACVICLSETKWVERTGEGGGNGGRKGERKEEGGIDGAE